MNGDPLDAALLALARNRAEQMDAAEEKSRLTKRQRDLEAEYNDLDARVRNALVDRQNRLIAEAG